MGRRKKTARRPRGDGFFHRAQQWILFHFLMIWLAALSLFDGGIDPTSRESKPPQAQQHFDKNFAPAETFGHAKTNKGNARRLAFRVCKR
jgi:hypothetical protein